MTGESTPDNREEALNRLKKLVLDHLGIPWPKQRAHIQTLQDELLPAFMDLAGHAWLASSPLPLNIGVLSNESSHTRSPRCTSERSRERGDHMAENLAGAIVVVWRKYSYV